MPPRGLLDLPGEVLPLVVAHYLDGSAIVQDPNKWIRDITTIASIDARFREATRQHLSRQFRMLHPSSSSPLPPDRMANMPWLPRTQPDPGTVTAYWRHHLGPHYDEVPPVAFQAAWLLRASTIRLKVLAVDIRVTRFDAVGTARTWNQLQAPQWIHSAAILSRILGTVSTLEEVHIRMSSQQDQLLFVQDIVLRNPKISSLIIEADTALDLVPSSRPIIDLSKFVGLNVEQPKLQRFVLRAPACEVVIPNHSSFLAHLAHAKEVRIAAYRLEASGQPWQWTAELLRACPHATAVELAACRGNSYGQIPPATIPPVNSLELLDLTLDLPEVDARLLRLIHAPALKSLRINTRTRVDEWGKLDLFHFPSLAFVRVGCYSAVSTRLETLGLPRRSFAHTLTAVEDEWTDYEGDFSADIRLDHQAMQPLPGSPASSASSSTSSLWLHSPHSATALVLLDPATVPTASPASLALQPQPGLPPTLPTSPSVSALATPVLHLSPGPEDNVFISSGGAPPSAEWLLPAPAVNAAAVNSGHSDETSDASFRSALDEYVPVGDTSGPSIPSTSHSVLAGVSPSASSSPLSKRRRLL
ncbi:hypothetical protein OC844_006563 [Tilletia horrida]|nr:hypothetical protein OC844_006563 [Tilletia horrida]